MADVTATETPTAKAIRLLGVKAIAHACDLTTNAVYKWPPHIPSKHQPAVMLLARDKGVRFTAEDCIGVAAA